MEDSIYNIILSSTILGAALLQLFAALGIVKYPTLLLRLHSSSKASTVGLGLMLIAGAIHFNVADIYLKTLLTLFFVFLSSPLVAHLFAKVHLDEVNSPSAQKEK